MARLDPHSYNDPSQVETETLDWKARIDFASKRLECEAVLTFREPGAGALDLDTRDLEIESVTTTDNRSIPFELAAPDPTLGSRLRLQLPNATRAVRIKYRTSPKSTALQWLSPAQTSGGRHPFLFSQCQAIHARSVAPLQDTPRIRIRYSAELTVPKALRALMAASFVSREEYGRNAIERYQMPQPIPPYLFAFAVGELVSRDVGPRSRVWAEPELLPRAAAEFEDVESILLRAENMFGPYEWERFDILTMPPSFPYGGMENPRLTFVTPTVIAGDKSLVNMVVHELSHSWTGNLVSNASAEHFWLNEGFTVFAERLLLEVLEGIETSALHAAVGRRNLMKALADHKDRPALNRLRTHLDGIHPDLAFSQVPYEKGYLFLCALEKAAGRRAFSQFIRKYVATFRFKAITTEEFVEFTRRELPGALEEVNAEEWIHGEGLPASAPAQPSYKLQGVERLGAAMPDEKMARHWTPAEWHLYLNGLPRPQSREFCQSLDARFGLSAKGNSEILVGWLTLAAESGYEPVLERIDSVLGTVGRMKYLRPLYTALARDPRTRKRARSLFERHHDSYHPIAQQVIAQLLDRVEARAA